jgi:hypothetical protein
MFESSVTVVPKCTLRGLGTPYHSTPTARYVDEKRLEDEGHLRVLCSIYAFLITCDYTRLYARLYYRQI